jgi:uncharacterized membrane protein YdcZ (DUF606 family)
MIWLFLAGLGAELLVSWQAKSLQHNKVARTAFLAIAGWMLWGFVLPEFVLSRINALPFAIGAGLGAGLVAYLHKED